VDVEANDATFPANGSPMRLKSYDDRSTTPKEERPSDNQKRNRPKPRQPRR